MRDPDSFDRRLTPARPDLAARFLEGEIAATRYVDGETFSVMAALAPLRKDPSYDAPLLTQALRGERMTVYDHRDDWAWGQLDVDGYVGWIPDAAIAPSAASPTHVVSAHSTFGFPRPSIKTPPVMTLPMGARLAIATSDAMFAMTDDGLHVPAQHLRPIGSRDRDYVAIAERFVGTPYLWGGKSSHGIDCSGLVQVALTACGISCPRDSDMQRDAFGTSVALQDAERGDLIFWKGHVAIYRDAKTIVHANAHHMATAIEPVAEAIARIAAAGNDVQAVRRIA